MVCDLLRICEGNSSTSNPACQVPDGTFSSFGEARFSAVSTDVVRPVCDVCKVPYRWAQESIYHTEFRLSIPFSEKFRLFSKFVWIRSSRPEMTPKIPVIRMFKGQTNPAATSSVDGAMLGKAPQISRRPSRARLRVTSSAYSRSPPTGNPRARRVTRTPLGCSNRAR